VQLGVDKKTLALTVALLFVALDVAEIYWGNYEADLSVHSGLSDVKLFQYATKVRKYLLLALVGFGIISLLLGILRPEFIALAFLLFMAAFFIFMLHPPKYATDEVQVRLDIIGDSNLSFPLNTVFTKEVGKLEAIVLYAAIPESLFAQPEKLVFKLKIKEEKRGYDILEKKETMTLSPGKEVEVMYIPESEVRKGIKEVGRHELTFEIKVYKAKLLKDELIFSKTLPKAITVENTGGTTQSPTEPTIPGSPSTKETLPLRVVSVGVFVGLGSSIGLSVWADKLFLLAAFALIAAAFYAIFEMGEEE